MTFHEIHPDALIRQLEEQAIGPDDTFAFSCDRCGRCCREREDILLNPADLFRIANFLDLTPREVTERYCECYIGPDSRIPILRLKPKPYRNTCPFLGPQGCSVHPAKPTVCALFPLGRAYIPQKDKLVYFNQSAPCGSGKTSHSVQDWLASFGLSYADEDSLRWMRLTPRLSLWMREHEPHLREDELRTIWTAMQNLCYLQYDIHQPFSQQFIRNTDELLQLLPGV